MPCRKISACDHSSTDVILHYSTSETDPVITLRTIIEKTKKMQDGLIWIMFVEYTKASDTVAHNKLSKALVEFGVPQHIVWVVEQLYNRVTGIIHVKGHI